MKGKAFLTIFSITMIFVIFGCSEKQEEQVVHKTYALNNLDGLLTAEGVEFDEGISSDGNGSLKITAPESTTVLLYETGDIEIENALLVYRAKIRTEKVIGQVFLEMWCSFPGRGEFFSRGLNSLVTSTTDWTESTTEFYLKAGENPDNVRLNLVINGHGTIWVDDITLSKHPLRWDER